MNEREFRSFSKILGQNEVITLLKELISKDKLPHAALFVGIPGTGKTTTAFALTQAINCQNPVDAEGCGECRICRQLRGNNFPDIEIVRPDGQHTKIEQVRELERKLGFKPLAEGTRVSVIQEAEKMTPEAANAFLKTLEEPPDDNMLILNVIEPLNLLPTIVSRCQKFRFRPISVQLIIEQLKERLGLEEEKAVVVAKLSDGSLGRAFSMAETDFLDKREEYIFKLMNLAGLSSVQVLEMAVELARETKGKDLGTLEKELSGTSGLLSIWKSWYRDLLVVKVNGSEEYLVNVDFSHKLKKVCKNHKIDNLTKSFKILERAQSELSKARNLELMMENTVLSLKRLAN